MTRGPGHSLRIAALGVLDGQIVVADTVVPVVIELDADGRVAATHTWALDPAAWFRRRDRPVLLRLDVTTGSIEEVQVDIDLTPFVPSVAPPNGVDLARYERGELEHLRGSFFGGLGPRDGERLPFIEGVTFESVELEGEFPDSAIVARFRADERPGIRFARRWNLYDVLGNVTPVYSADLELMADVEASGYGLPPLVHCRRDEDRIVWF